MTVALILSVVALVAVSQPINFNYAPHPFQPCELIGRAKCCLTTQAGGCRAPPDMYHRNYGRLPPYYQPPPNFLAAVCCQNTEECCPYDETDWNPRFRCCDATEKCTVTSKKGVCEAKASTDDVTPEVKGIEANGQCPEDGSLPIAAPNGLNGAYQCTLNGDVTGNKCPTNSHCVRDNSKNANAGVCCRDTTKTNAEGNVTTIIGCNMYTDCGACVSNNPITGVQAPCGWLSQGSLSNNQPRCVINCANFPSKTCRPAGSPTNSCPVNLLFGTTRMNATVINTGTCDRRCGWIGTGRAAGINNNGNRVTPNTTTITSTACCMDYPGDYCCDKWGQLALHCTVGRQGRNAAICGIPVRGTPNQLYIPQFEPLGMYNNAPQGTPWPTPYGNFPPYGQPFGYGAPGNIPSYGQGFHQNPYFGVGPMPYGQFGMPPMYGQPYGWRSDGEVVSESEEDIAKNLMWAPPPMYYPQPPPPQPRRIPWAASINPSPFVCSCDHTCIDYADCCSDYTEECTWPAAEPEMLL